MHDYTNNEDAGDLTAMSRADYHGEMNAQRDHDRQMKYQDAFDGITTGPRPLFIEYFEIPSAKGHRVGRVAYPVHGPRERPYCDACAEPLTRDAPEAIYSGDYRAEMFCNQECRDHWDAIHEAVSADGREFPTYG